MVSHVEAFYALHRDPFPIAGGTGSVLVTQPLKKATDALNRHLAADAGIICIAGASGVGKTSLLRALPRLIPEDVVFCQIRDHAAGWNVMLSTIIRELRLPGELLSRNTLMAARERGRRLVLAVDDAHRLDPKSLDRIAVLTRLQGNAGEPLVQAVFLADLAVARARMESPLLAWLDARYCHELGPMPADGVHAYLHTRLRRVGWKAEPLFNREASAALHARSQGNPRALGIVSLECLECAAERGLQRIDDGFVAEIFGARGAGEPAPGHAPQPMPPTPTTAPARDRFHVRATAPVGSPGAAGAGLSDLTAESILAAPSLDLSGRAPTPSPTQESPLQSMRSVARPAAASTAELIRHPVQRRRRWRGLKWFGALVALIVLTFAARPELRAMAGGLEEFVPDFELPTALRLELIWPSPERAEDDFAVSAPPPRD